MMRKKCLRLLAAALSAIFLTANSAFAAATPQTVYMVANAHIDVAWKWTKADTVRNIGDTFGLQAARIDNFDDYKFTAPVSLSYEWAKEYYPAVYETVKKRIKEGTWEVSGGQYVEPDFNIPSGESLVRQVLYGKQFFQKEFGVNVKTGLAVDAFGFSFNTPQIFKKSGINNLVITRMLNNDLNKFPYETFTWKGADSSQLSVYQTAYEYMGGFVGNDRDPNKNIEMVKKSLQKPSDLGLNKSLYLWGRGDTGGGPKDSEIMEVEEYSSMEGMPKVKFATLDDYFNSLTDKEKKLFPVWDDELYLENYRGVYTSQAAIKKYNRLSEVKAEEAEKFASMADWLGAADYPYDKITKAWSKINMNQFHDIIWGTSIEKANIEAWNDSEQALNYLNTTIDHSLGVIAERADTTGIGKPIVVFNPLSWVRTDIVETELDLDTIPASVTVYDPDGKQVPAQIGKLSDNKVKLTFYASQVPSMGYKVFRAVADQTSSGDSTKAEPYVMENERLKLTLNPDTGNIKSIYDKVNKKEALMGGEGNALQILKDSTSLYPLYDRTPETNNYRDYNAVPESPSLKSVTLLESGPAKTVYRVEKTWRNSSLIQDIVLYADSDRIDVKMGIDWKDSNYAVKVSFPTCVKPTSATFEIPYGAIERPNTRDTAAGKAKHEVPGQRWADLSDSGYGVSILNDGKYGWDTRENTIRLTLLKSSTQVDASTPYPTADIGFHEFTYSIYPHAGDWKSAKTVQKGHELNYPLVGLAAGTHNGTLGKAFSFLSVDSPNVVASVVKRSEDGKNNEMVVRLYETQGKSSTTANIKFAGNITSASETDLLEKSIGKAVYKANQLTAKLGKYEIKTFRLKLSSPYYKNTKPVTASVDLSKAFNKDGISANSDRKDGNLDGKGNSLSAELLPSQVVSEGITFKLGSEKKGAKNFIECTGQTVSVPAGNYKAVYILGTAAGGNNQESGTLKAWYSDNSFPGTSLMFRDWVTTVGGWGQQPINDTIAFGMTHRHLRNGEDDIEKSTYLYKYKVELDPKKKLTSLKLPANSKMKILGITLLK